MVDPEAGWFCCCCERRTFFGARVVAPGVFGVAGLGIAGAVGIPPEVDVEVKGGSFPAAALKFASA